MTTIEAQIPEFVLEQARTLAEREGIPLEQLISLAVTHSVGVWSHESYVTHRAKHGSREAFEHALAEVPVPDKFAVARENSLDVLGVVGSS